MDLLLSGTGPDPVVLPVFTAPALPTGVAPVPPGALNRLFDLVQIIKNSTGYNDTIGQDLRIIGTTAVDSNAAGQNRPEAKPTIVQGAATGRQDHFVKHGHMGVYIECQRGTGPMEFMAIDTEIPYLDDRPLLVAGDARSAHVPPALLGQRHPQRRLVRHHHHHRRPVNCSGDRVHSGGIGDWFGENLVPYEGATVMSKTITVTVDLINVDSSQRLRFSSKMGQQGWSGPYQRTETDWPYYVGNFPPAADEYLIKCSIENALAAAAGASGLACTPKYKIA